MNWFPDRERRLHNQLPLPNDGAGLNAAFLAIERNLLEAERSHRLLLQAERNRACELLLDAILALDAALVDERLQADPLYLQHLGMEGWTGLLAEAKRGAGRRRAASTREVAQPSLPVAHSLQPSVPVSTVATPAVPHPARPIPPLAASGDLWLLPDTVPLPDLPAKAPIAYAHSFKGASWPKRRSCLALLAQTGWSSHSLLLQTLAGRLGLSTNTVTTAPKALVVAGLLTYEVVVTRCGKLGLVELSAKGLEMVRDMGWTAVPSEWQRLRHMLGAEAPEQTAKLISLAGEARKRGFGVWVCPRPCTGEPDLLVRDVEGEETAVFLEPDPAQVRLQAWQEAAAARGRVGLCAIDPEGRDLLVRQAFAVGLAGLATDLTSLRAGQLKTLWAEQWLATSGQQEADT